MEGLGWELLIPPGPSFPPACVPKICPRRWGQEGLGRGSFFSSFGGELSGWWVGFWFWVMLVAPKTGKLISLIRRLLFGLIYMVTSDDMSSSVPCWVCPFLPPVQMVLVWSVTKGAEYFQGYRSPFLLRQCHQKHHFYATILARRCHYGFYAMSNSILQGAQIMRTLFFCMYVCHGGAHRCIIFLWWRETTFLRVTSKTKTTPKFHQKQFSSKWPQGDVKPKLRRAQILRSLCFCMHGGVRLVHLCNWPPTD